MKTTIKSIAVALAFCAAAFLTVSAIIENTAPNGSEKYIMRDYRVAKTKAAVIITQALGLMMNSRILFLLSIFIRPYQTYR